MDAILEILRRNNPPHVIHVRNRNGNLLEELYEDENPNIIHIIQGISELNKNGIVLLDISVGKSAEGITKIKNIESMGLFRNEQWIHDPVYPEDVQFPEGDLIPFKSDSWALGEFIVKHKTGGKSIPKRFLKSQRLLDIFSDSIDSNTLRKLLVLNPENRSYTWDLIPRQQGGGVVEEGCNIQ